MQILALLTSFDLFSSNVGDLIPCSKSVIRGAEARRTELEFCRRLQLWLQARL